MTGIQQLTLSIVTAEPCEPFEVSRALALRGLRAKESRAWAILSQLSDMGLVSEYAGIWGATAKGREMVAEVAA